MIALKENISAPAIAEVDADPSQVIEPAIEISEAALKQMRRALARRQRDEPNAFVRIGVKGGGSSGMSYFMEPDTEFDERDRTWVAGGLRIVSDERSLRYISGMIIDYDIKNLMEGGFLYRNPNAARSCGCGTSFTPK